MLFNTGNFLIFFSIIFIIYWYCLGNSLKLQNLLLLLSSFIFYSVFSFRYLAILIIVILFNYFISNIIFSKKSERTSRFFYLLGLIGNLGLLIFFKYYNFFIDSFGLFALSENQSLNLHIDILVPLGISFYIFHAISYLIDLKRGNLLHNSNIVNFSLFFSFFPFLIAGPIERSNTLLPQFYVTKKFCYSTASIGLRIFIIGLAKKVIIADSISVLVDNIFNNYSQFNSSTLIIGAIGFSFQIYADFSGYSDMAIGISKLLGFELTNNFNYPYFSENLIQFWKKWHISLTNWFRDYLYIPLGGNKGSLIDKNTNIMIVFFISGLWHGASWNFILWGCLHGVSYIFLSNLKKPLIPNTTLFLKIIKILFTFIFVTLCWIPFRMHNFSDTCNYFRTILNFEKINLFFSVPNGISIFIYIIPLILYDFFNKYKLFIPSIFKTNNYKHFFYFLLTFLLFLYWSRNDHTNYIYFNF